MINSHSAAACSEFLINETDVVAILMFYAIYKVFFFFFSPCLHGVPGWEEMPWFFWLPGLFYKNTFQYFVACLFFKVADTQGSDWCSSQQAIATSS